MAASDHGDGNEHDCSEHGMRLEQTAGLHATIDNRNRAPPRVQFGGELIALTGALRDEPRFAPLDVRESIGVAQDEPSVS